MNTIKKQKGALIGLGVFALVASILLIVFGVLLIVKGATNLEQTSGIVKLVVGIVMALISMPLCVCGIKMVWVGAYMTATTGSIKMGNIAKEGGTVNMKKCDKCGTELKDGETKCSNCGKLFE